MTVIDTAGLARVHDAALRLLAEVGVVVLEPEALALLAAHGAAVEGQRVRLDERLVATALATAPASYTVAGRRAERDLAVGAGEAVLAGASGPAFIIDRGGRRHGVLADVRDAVALTHQSANVDVYGQAIGALDVPDERRPQAVAYACTTGTDRGWRVDVTTELELQVACDVAEIVFGADWHDRPRLWIVINSTSPLQLSAEAGRALLRLARLGQPVCLAVCAMAGTTAPRTLAGVLAVQHAELLVGLVLSQVVRPGCPFLYGATSSLASMRTGALLMGVPEYWALTEAAVALGHSLGLPVRAGGALTDAHVPDAQAGAESALALEATLRTGADFVLHAAGILSSFNSFSPAKFVIDDELIGALRAARRPLVVDDESLAVDVLAAVGPGGTLLSHNHTRRHARANGPSALMNRETYEAWLAAGADDLAARAWRRVDELLAAYEPPDDLDAVTLRQLEAYCLG
ncbi:MAG TPA: trimethylamine methyltransferase family protein [Thermoleophilia bacterium]|nr:trimethylamine methyltransferase family protein [Thermoleophilia bacterium]